MSRDSSGLWLSSAVEREIRTEAKRGKREDEEESEGMKKPECSLSVWDDFQLDYAGDKSWSFV